MLFHCYLIWFGGSWDGTFDLPLLVMTSWHVIPINIHNLGLWVKSLNDKVFPVYRNPLAVKDLWQSVVLFLSPSSLHPTIFLPLSSLHLSYILPPSLFLHCIPPSTLHLSCFLPPSPSIPPFIRPSLFAAWACFSSSWMTDWELGGMPMQSSSISGWRSR